jgi:hypothetical protein
MPRVKVTTYSAGLLQNLWDTGKFIGVAGGFSLRLLGKRLGIEALSVDLPVWPFPKCHPKGTPPRLAWLSIVTIATLRPCRARRTAIRLASAR